MYFERDLYRKIPRKTQSGYLGHLSSGSPRAHGMNAALGMKLDILSRPVDQECTQLCRALSLFVVEARKRYGEHYPLRTVYPLLAGLHPWCQQPSLVHYRIAESKYK